MFLALQIGSHHSLGFGAGPFSKQARYRKRVKENVITSDFLRCD